MIRAIPLALVLLAGVNPFLLADMQQAEATRRLCLQHRAVADQYVVCRQYLRKHR